MNGDVIVWIGGTGTVGVLVGWGVAWGMTRQTLKNLVESHGRLKSSFIEHQTNTTIHVDPIRDPKEMTELKQTIQSGFQSLNLSMGTVQERCSRRVQDCADHFSKLEKKIAAVTGQSNGGD